MAWRLLLGITEMEFWSWKLSTVSGFRTICCPLVAAETPVPAPAPAAAPMAVPLLGPAISLNGITLPIHVKPCQLNHQIRLAGKAACRLHFHHSTFNISRGRNHGFAFNHNW